ncbi:hypothetical protein X798_07440 [Onchocerca flexuosa]|uniref:TROVE domain-containing protein n=1 Tax=Onchocerca flexuosa TaxID=387005 RepID=A0A238BL14_9BILA|nr:hypothetical protein X798_07440 [Onchocerca flexuosa]
MQVTKYRNFEGYNHRDLFRLCHIHPNLGLPSNHNYWKYYTEYDAIFKFVVEDNMKLRKRKETLTESKIKRSKLDDEKAKTEQQTIEMEKEIEGMAELTLTRRNEATLIEKMKTKRNEATLIEEMKSKEAPNVETSKVLQFLKNFQQLQALTVNDGEKAAELINKHDFVYEHIPKILLNSKDIWKSLLVRMPLKMVMENLGKMTIVDLLGSKEHHCMYNQIIVDKLMDEKILKEMHIQPIDILLTYATYSIGIGYDERREIKWNPSKDIVNALEKAFYSSIQYIVPTNKRYCLFFNISGI